ncbi:MBL fold metallo-hydrolase [Nocardioides eburneiflavus]|nr:MBL fold metallo-hydrolase [Nocardioides eburneiflavus]
MTDPDWTAPGCHPVLPGIHRIPLPMPQDGLRAVNVYAIEGPDGLALVDAGWRVPGALDVLGAALASISRDLSEVRDVVVTHVHRDHYTLAPALRRAAGTRVHLGAGEAVGLGLVRDLGGNDPVSSFEQLARAGAGDLVDAVRILGAGEEWNGSDWEDPDHWLEPGMLALAGREVEVVPTPGHTKGHVVLHDLVAGALFTGDHVLPTITPSIGFELGDWELPLGRYLESLELLLLRADAVMLPAHGAPGGSVHQRVRELLSHHDQRFARTVSAVAEAPGSTGIDVAGRLGWTRRDRPFDGLDPFNQMIATCETMAHLDVLAERGLLSVAYDGPVARFAVAAGR